LAVVRKPKILPPCNRKSDFEQPGLAHLETIELWGARVLDANSAARVAEKIDTQKDGLL